MLDAAFSMKRKEFKIPLFIRKKYKVIGRKIMNKDIATIVPENHDSALHIIYLHGGAYITQGSIIHWFLIKKILDSVKCKVTYLDYPLAPEANYKDTFSMISSAYSQITNKYPNDRFVFAGDSAGGGLALAFAQSIVKAKKLISPSGLILLSPWLDLSMKNKEIKNYENKDVILSSKSLIKAAKMYSGGDNLDSDLSPNQEYPCL